MEISQLVFFQELCLSYHGGGKNKLRDIESEFSAGYPEKVFWFYLPTKKQKRVIQTSHQIYKKNY